VSAPAPANCMAWAERLASRIRSSSGSLDIHSNQAAPSIPERQRALNKQSLDSNMVRPFQSSLMCIARVVALCLQTPATLADSLTNCTALARLSHEQSGKMSPATLTRCDTCNATTSPTSGRRRRRARSHHNLSLRCSEANRWHHAPHHSCESTDKTLPASALRGRPRRSAPELFLRD
jgi:hypothetical protein